MAPWHLDIVPPQDLPTPMVATVNVNIEEQVEADIEDWEDDLGNDGFDWPPPLPVQPGYPHFSTLSGEWLIPGNAQWNHP